MQPSCSIFVLLQKPLKINKVIFLITNKPFQFTQGQSIKDCAFNIYDTLGKHNCPFSRTIEWPASKCSISFPVPYAPATNLVVYNETTTSLNARWNPAPGPVQNYSITYVPTSGGRPQTVSSTPQLLFSISHMFGFKSLADIFHSLHKQGIKEGLKRAKWCLCSSLHTSLQTDGCSDKDQTL